MRPDDYSGYRLIMLVALLAICGAAFTLYRVAPTNSRIAGRERVVTGHFVAHVGEGRSTRIVYAYSVNGLSYEKRDSCWNWLMPCQVGAEVPVYYDPLNPSESKLMDYHRELARGIRFCSIAIAVGCFVLGLSYLSMRRAQRRNS